MPFLVCDFQYLFSDVSDFNTSNYLISMLSMFLLNQCWWIIYQFLYYTAALERNKQKILLLIFGIKQIVSHQIPSIMLVMRPKCLIVAT